MKIEILGTGCPKCRQTRENVESALMELAKEAEVVAVKDLRSIADYGVMLTPALVVDGDVKIVGKVPSVEDIKTLIG